MMNIEKFLNVMINLKVEKLVLNNIEPPYVIKGGKKNPVLKRILTKNELEIIVWEYQKMFSNSETLTYRNKNIDVKVMDKCLEFTIRVNSDIKEEILESVQEEELEKTESFPSMGITVNEASDTIDLDQLFHLMVEKNASDLHLPSGCKPAMRIDGDIVQLVNFPLISEKKLSDELNKIIPERNSKEFNQTNDTDFAYEIKGVARFRSNIFRDHRGICAVFRQIPSKILTVDELNIPQAFVDLCNIPKGLILVTGPTGSGKPTTLAALIDHINKTKKKHIVTVEDPIEFVYPNQLSLINQREVNTHTQSFKVALRAALREDPDIILVGEMRDLETISIAIEMAVTGHLVFATLHTSTAIATIDRIIDQFPSNQQQQIKTMLADSLIGVCSQNLLKRKQGGRVGAYEILISTVGVSNLIREGKNFQIANMMQTGKNIGMQMLNSALSDLVEKNIVSTEEAFSRALDKKNLKSLFTMNNNIEFTNDHDTNYTNLRAV